MGAINSYCNNCDFQKANVVVFKCPKCFSTDMDIEDTETGHSIQPNNLNGVSNGEYIDTRIEATNRENKTSL